MNSVFKKVGSLRPSRSLFNLSYEKKFSCDMGQLIPVLCDEMVPGDVFDIGASMVIRFQPLVAPVLHQVDAFYHVFFIPYRLLWDDWEDFITGGVLGTLTPTLPRWIPSSDAEVAEGSLWDYMGFPTFAARPVVAADTLPMDFPKRAYQLVFNDYYRDETLQVEATLGAAVAAPYTRSWEKDYFTSALLWQQRGTPPAIPIVGTAHALWDISSFQWDDPAGALSPKFDSAVSDNIAHTNSQISTGNLRGFLNDNDVDLSAATPFSISDLRTAFQVQKWLERNARAGVRYTEFLKSHFGVAPSDERLDRPEYIGGMKAPVIFTEVLQTSETGTTPQGNLAGHGLSVGFENIGRYHAQEYGCVLGILSIMPKPAYQQGVNRQWLRITKEDFYFPEFANLSEQEIKQGELYWTDLDSANNTVFGFCGAYDEMRVKHSMVCGEFRSTYDYWHIGRQFGAAPVLDSTFIKCIPRKDIFAVPAEPGCLIQFGNIIKALRPLPIIAEPGLIDHH